MDAVEEVRSRLSVEDVISEYVSLKRSGHNFKAISPFTNEKTASLIVSPEKQIWKDFSSGKGGSIYDFVMEVEGLDFRGALELLARKAGVELEEFQGKTKGPNKKRLYEAIELATKFYQVQFSRHKSTLDYVLNERKFTKDTALTWRLGYSPNTGLALIKFLKSKDYREAEMLQAGLISKAYRGGYQDMFRGRLMVPLMDNEGRVIGFTARILEDNVNAPKYINTPQTILYDKSKHVYGLSFAKEAIRKSNFCVITEGNLDVIASHQAGVNQTVATAGTAMTENQLKALGRFTQDIRLCYDQDRAGITATERAIPIASKVGLTLSIIDIPSGKDPDELIRQDPAVWQSIINKPVYALDWLIEHYANELDLTSAVGKRKFSDIVLATVNQLSDPVEVDHYLNKIAKLTSVSVDALNQKLVINQKSEKIRPKKPINQQFVIDKPTTEYIRTQDRYLSLVLKRQTLRELNSTILTKAMMPTDDGRALFEYLLKKPDYDALHPINEQKLTDYVKIELLLYEELYQDLQLNELYDEALRLKNDLVSKYVKTEKTKLLNTQKTAVSSSELRLLQEKDNQLNQLLNQVKGA